MAVASFQIRQSDFTTLLLFLLPGFLLCFYLSKKTLTSQEILGAGIVVRLFFLFHLPILSDDFYRFLWDGLVVLEGFNPYQYTPAQFVEMLSNNSEFLRLYPYLNSPDYYSVYPPLSQLIFSFTTWLSGQNPYLFQLILGMLFLFADILLLYFLRILLKIFHISLSWLTLYFLNPYVVIEFCGNLHFDLFLGLAIVLGLVLLHRKKYSLALLIMAAATAIKPQFVLLVPFLLLALPTKKCALKIGLFYSLICLLVYSPLLLYSGTLGFDDSLDLYFRKFEFNASLYLLFRWVGYQLIGYNTISYVGPLMALMAFTVVLYLWFRAWALKTVELNTRKLLHLAVMAFSIYLLLSTTVHPWYLFPLLVLGILTEKRWVVLWSFTIMWSYAFYDPWLHGYHNGIGLVAYTLPFLLFTMEYNKSSRVK